MQYMGGSLTWLFGHKTISILSAKYIYGMPIYILDNKGYPLFFQMAHDITFKKREITLNVGMLYDCKHKGRDQLWK